MKIKIINAPSDLGVSVDGASLGPEKIKEIVKDDKKINKIIDLYCDCSNKSYSKNDMKKNLDRINEFSNILYSTLSENKDKDTITITIGGDHSIAVPSALASIKEEESLGIIWIDTHPDFNTFETTLTGNIHGLPLASITGNNGNELSKYHNGNFIKNENTVIIGARDTDTLEQENLNKANIKVYSTNDVKNSSISKIVTESIDKAINNTNGIHVSIDIDVLDPEVAPGVSVSFKNGLTKEELYKIIDTILIHKDKLKSFDIVEFNPTKDIDNKTLNIAVEILEKIINTYA